MEFYNYRKTQYGIKWQLIFHHNSKNSEFFNKNDEDVLFTKTNDFNKFSILGLLTDSSKHFGFYEFLLEYPSLNPSFIHWKQKKNPNDIKQGDENIEYRILSPSKYTTRFSGLGKSNQTDLTLFTGSLKETGYWYSIGARTDFHASKVTFPGPPIYDSNENGIGVEEVYLWIKIGFEYPCTNLPISSKFVHFLINIIIIVKL